jgi:hypothetical protein
MRTILMRKILAAMLIAAATGWIGATAAPINPAALDAAANAVSPLSQAWYYRHHGRVCYAKCYHEFIIGRRVCRRFC